jgi:hypothetical protein
MVNVQGDGGTVGEACVTVTRCPATITLPTRRSPLLGATVKLTVPFPLPLVAEVGESQVTSVPAVHAHSLSVATLTVPAPPSAPTSWFEGPTS